jgi:signal transduction histidine kinase/HAMP domain-containing protein
MRRSSLGLVLIALNVSLALVAVAGLAGAAAALLRRFTDDQALERVRVAAVAAERGIASQGETLAAMTLLLADHASSTDLLAKHGSEGAAANLEGFRSTGGLAAAAVMRGVRVVASAGPALDWTEIARSASAPAFSLAAPKTGGLQLACAAPLRADPAYVVVATTFLDARFAQRLSDQIGATVRLVDAARGVGELGDPKLSLRARLVHDAAPEAKRIDEIGAYVTVSALRGLDGRVAGFLETEIPTSPAREARLRLVRRLSLLAVAIGGLAALASVVVARRIAAPLERLTEAADRIGGGDLTTPVGTAGWAEIGRLAASMEEMRRRLRRLTADLEAQKAEARAMVNGIVEGVYVVDGERRVVQMNPQAAAALSISPESAIGKFCGDVLNPEATGNVRPCEENCPILHARFRGEARATERLVLPDGRRRTVVVTSSMSGGDRQFQLLRDETEIEAARRLRDAVLANISHEFKTPLAAQLVSLELLVDRLADLGPDETRKLIVSLQRGALRLTQLIDNLLESVRIEAGRVMLRRQPLRLDEVVEEAVEMIRPLADQRGQSIDLQLPHPLPAVAGDGPRLVQVFVNLLANAGKFAPDHSTIRVGGDVAAGQLTLFVEDEGPGWSEEVEPHLFEPFVRSTGDEPESSGVGLGLYIAKSIVERHGGSIDASSGSGRTRVAVKLPLTGRS